jgi:deazaflavin-dependent oxidoreductase (nitroreductase family)
MQEGPPDLDRLAHESFCYLTTTGRVTGGRHTIEIWFGLSDATVYMLSGGRDRSDWVRNIMASPEVTLRIADRVFDALGRIVADPDEDRLARDLVVDKYSPGYGGDLSSWRVNALVVAVDLRPGPLVP